MRIPSTLILACCGSAAIVALAREPMPLTSRGSEPQVSIYKAIDLRPAMARMHLKQGRNTVYTNKQGTTLQAVVDRRGAITGYVLVDAAGKLSKVQARTPLSPPLEPGQMALVHKCVAITQECLNNPLPRSGNPDDCMIEIQCPNTALSNILSR